MVDRRIAWGLVAGVVASTLVTVSTARQTFTYGSPTGGWVYPYVRGFRLLDLATGFAAAAIALIVIAVPRHRLAVGWTGSFVLHSVMRSRATSSIGSLIGNATATSFYWVTMRQSAAAVLRDFISLRGDWPMHAASNMPGKLMLFYAIEQFSADPTFVGLSIVTLSTLGGLLIYLLTVTLVDDRRIAFYAAILYWCLPAIFYFTPLINTVTPTLVLAVACLFQWWMRYRRWWLAAMVGVGLWALLFFEPLTLVVGIVFLFLLYGTRPPVRHLAVAAGAFTAIHVVVRLLWGFDAFTTFVVLARDATAFNLGANRPYGVWTYRNLVELMLAVGLPQIALFVASFREPFDRPMMRLSLGLVAVTITLTLLGVNRGEVLRLWIFLAGVFQIPVAAACARFQTDRGLAVVISASLIQTAITISMIGFVVG